MQRLANTFQSTVSSLQPSLARHAIRPGAAALSENVGRSGVSAGMPTPHSRMLSSLKPITPILSRRYNRSDESPTLRHYSTPSTDSERLFSLLSSPPFGSGSPNTPRSQAVHTGRTAKAKLSTVLWTPSEQQISSSQMHRFQAFLHQRFNVSFEDYQQLHQWSVQHKSLFWSSVAEFCEIHFHQAPHELFQPGATFQSSQWFVGAQLNFAENLLKKGLQQENKPAIISFSENGQRVSLSFKELEQQVSQLMTFLRNEGVQVGDRIGGILPNSHEAVVAMLATTGVGAIWTACSPDFGVNSILDRLGQTQPKILFTTQSYEYKGKPFDISAHVQAVASAVPSIQRVVTIDNSQAGSSSLPADTSLSWKDALGSASSARAVTPEYASVPFNQPAFILYSSGTTGQPKCITHSVGGTLLQHAKELRLHTNLDDQSKHLFFTTCGWMMWNWLTSSLQTGASIVLYDGNPFYPGPERLLELIEQEGVSTFGAGASYYSHLEKQGVTPAEHFNLDSLKTLLSTGSPLSPDSYRYIYRAFKEDVCLSSISGGTDIISCFALGNPALPVRTGELQCIGLGMDVDIVNEQGESVRGEKGELVCKTPFPSMPVGFWGDPQGEKYQHAYFDEFEGIWAHGDYAEITEHHGLIIHGRSDSILNPGGVRIGTAEIYRQLDSIPEITESVVVGQRWHDDVRVVLFVCLQPGVELDDALISTIKNTIRTQTSPRHVPSVIAAVPAIPKTFSGKIVEVAVRNTVNGEEVKNKSAIANPECLAYFKPFANDSH